MPEEALLIWMEGLAGGGESKMEQGCCVLCVCVCVCVCVYDRERERRTKRLILNNFMLALRPTYFHNFPSLFAGQGFGLLCMYKIHLACVRDRIFVG